MKTLVQSILRSEIGKHDLEEIYSNRTMVSKNLTQEADRATGEWGIEVIRLEIKEFELGDFQRICCVKKSKILSVDSKSFKQKVYAKPQSRKLKGLSRLRYSRPREKN